MNPDSSIVILCDKNSRTSFGRLALDLKQAIGSERGASILWLKTPKYFPDDAEKREPSDAEIWSSSLYAGFLGFRKPLAEYLRKRRPQTVLLIRPELGFLVSCVRKALPGAKVVVLVHDTFAETLYPFSLKFKLIAEFYAKPAERADGFIYNSDYTRREAEKFYGIGDRPCVVAGLPLNPEYGRERKEVGHAERKAFFERFGLEGFSQMVLNISLPERRKNIETFFDLAKRRPDLAFVRIGTVNRYVQRILEERNLRNVFHFSSLSSETLLDFYRNASLYVAPSLYEGFGLPPLEAIACGTSVVCAKTTALAEIFDGVCPLVSPATNVDGYLGILQDVLDGKFSYDPQKVERLLSRYRLESISDRLTRFFEGLKRGSASQEIS